MGTYVTLWHDGCANGRLSSRAAVQIRTEAEYQTVRDDDVVIVVDPSGRRLDLNALFDGLTTYRKDYVEHPPQRRVERPEIEWDMPRIPDISRLMFKTSYGDHYKPIAIKPRPRSAAPAPRERLTSATGHSTYTQSYLPYPIKPAARDTHTPSGGLLRPWPQDYTTTYNRDMVRHPRGLEPAMPPHGPGFPERDAHAPWLPTEYTDEYVEKSAPPHYGDAGFERVLGVDGPQAEKWRTTYDTEYLGRQHAARGVLNVDPELPLRARIS